MVKKNLEKSLKQPYTTDRGWKNALERGECPLGCNLRTNTCEHLDAYLTPENQSVVAMSVGGQIEKFPDKKDGYEEEKSLLELVTGQGLSDIEIEVLMQSIGQRNTYSQIAKNLGYESSSTVHRIKKQALIKLKEKLRKIANDKETT